MQHNPPQRRAPSDPVFPSAGLFPLAHRGGGYAPLPNTPGPVRAFVATLAVTPPVQAKKHDTNPSRWTENKPTQMSKDGQVVPDTTPIVHTDS